jgi:hypothetical protein
MQTAVQGNSTSNVALWGGGIMSGLVIAARDSMRMGWTRTMEQLEAYLAKAQ